VLFDDQASALRFFKVVYLPNNLPSGLAHLAQLIGRDGGIDNERNKCKGRDNDGNPGHAERPTLIFLVIICIGCAFTNFYAFWQVNFGTHQWWNALLYICSLCCLGCCFGYGFFLVLKSLSNISDSGQQAPCEYREFGWPLFHDNTVPRKYPLTSINYRGTVIGIGSTQMANVLDSKKQVAIIGALADGSSIRSIERTTGVQKL
jgi:hypothetical protein